MKQLILAIIVAVGTGLAQEHGKAGHAAQPAAEHGTSPAHGSTHGQAPMPNEIWWKWANFAIIAAGLGFLIGKNAGPFFRTRTEEIQKGIREAAAVRADAEARAAAIENRIANLNAEVEAMRKNSQDEIAREGERVRAETAAQIEKIQKQAEAEIASAGKNASQELKAYAAELAIRLAQQQIRQQMTSQNQEQLADAFVDDIRRKAALN